MRTVFFASALLLSLGGLSAPAGADALRECTRSEPARRIAACSEIVAKGGDRAMRLAVAYHNRGRAYIQSREYDKGIADATEAIRLDPRYARAYSLRAWGRNEKREFDAAVADASEALRLNPKLPQAHNLRGWAHAGRGDFDAAIVDLNEAIRRTPAYAPAYSNRGWAYTEKRDFARAIADLDEAIRLDPTFVLAWHNRAAAYRAKGDLDRAVADLDEAIRLNPKSARAYSNRGLAYAGKGNRERAIADYRKVIELPAVTAQDRQRQEAARARIERLMQDQGASSRRVALVIGNANYANVGPLTNPRNDARAIAAALRRLGFSKVMELYDLDQAGMGRALKEFGDHASGAEWAVVFFAGHGLEINGTNYLLPVDAELKRDAHVADEAISLDRIQAKVDGAGKLGLVVLDACRNNPFLARMARTKGTRSVGRGLAGTEPEGNVLVAYSAKHGTFAEDGAGEHSPFTEALLAHLEEPGLEMNFLFRKVRDAVRKKTDRRQDPFVYGSLGSEPLYFKAATATR
jgi:tetratricopeptide (TPR) repeat protein